MHFSYNPQDNYYTFYNIEHYADGDFLVPYRIPFGSFIVDFLFVDIDELTQILKQNITEHIIFNCNHSGWDLHGYDKVKKILCPKYNEHIISLILEKLISARRKSYETKSGVTLFSTIDAIDCTFKSLQHDLSDYIISGTIAEASWCAILEDHQEINVEIKFNENSSKIYMYYSVKDLISLIALDFVNIQNKNISIKQCANCKLFFIPSSRSDEIYCDRIFENGKTCKQLGYSIKEKNDPFKREFAKARKTQHARIRYNKHIKNYKENHYLPWLKAAKEAKKKYENSGDIDGFLKWLKDNKNKF